MRWLQERIKGLAAGSQSVGALLQSVRQRDIEGNRKIAESEWFAVVTAAANEKVKARTSKPRGDIEPLQMVGRLKGTISRVRVPSLTFSFARRAMKSYWSAFWHGHTLPFRFQINNEVQKDTLVGRVAFATSFIIVDSVVVAVRHLFKNRIPWEVVAIVAVVVALADGIGAKDFSWLLFVPPVAMVCAVPFSILRFRKWKGFKTILRGKAKSEG